MSKRVLSLILPGLLLLLAGLWFLGHRASRPAASQQRATAPAATIAAKPVVSNRAASTAPVLFASRSSATNAVAKTNAFPFRLSNTKKSIGQLQQDPHAILLENAFIVTGGPLKLSIPKSLQAAGDPGAYLVQADHPIDGAFRATLAAAGAQIVSYIPNNAYLVTLDAGGAAGLTGRPGVQSVLPYEPYYKISSSLIGLAVAQTNLPAGTALTLGLFANQASQTLGQIKKLGATVVATDQSPFGPVVRVQPPRNWTALAALPGVQILEPAYRRALANDLARVTLGISTDTVTNADYMNLFGSNVVVEVNDTGIDAGHPDFSFGGSAETPGSSPPSRVFGDSALSLVDTNGHGTHVAGIIAGNGSESYLVASIPQGSVTNADFRGKAPAATLYSVPALDNNGTLNISDSYLQSAPALTNALISNNSWVYVGDNTYDLAAASYDAAVRDALPLVTGSQPVLFVFAAGNDGGGDDGGGGGDPDTILSPGTAKNVITVGALEELRNITNIVTDATGVSNAVWQPQTDTSYQVAGYSSRGNVGIGSEGAFGRFKPDVVAPGSFVVSTRSEQWDQAAYYNPTNDNITVFPDFVQPQTFSDPNSASFYVYKNAAVVTIQLEPAVGATSPLPPLPIYVWPGTDPNTTAPVLAGTNSVTLSAVPNDIGWACAVSNTTDSTVVYNLVVDVLTTNDLGDYFTVLSNLNESIGPWYRYESGTSMATPAVSGSLALIQDYFTNTLHATPSPALLKAMLINGARAVDGNPFNVTNAINLQGWGLANVPDSVPPGITNQLGVECSLLFLDQSPSNALATGDSQTYQVAITNDTAVAQPLRVTLAWTDPPGNPAAAIKLVNSLTLVVSNNLTGDVYFGNDIPSSSTFNEAWNTNAAPNVDVINNIQNVYLPAASGSNYTVTVVGRSVNVNAVTAQTNNVVQDYALVISSGDGVVTNAMIVTAATPGLVSNPTSDQNITIVGVDATGMATNTEATGGVFLNQYVGANTPLLGTNTVSVGTLTMLDTNGVPIPIQGFASNAVVTAGMTNQWHFYVVQNNTTFSNAAFVTFLPDTLAMPRMGVYADPTQNPSQPEADIDLYVSTNPGLTNLAPDVISNCLNGTQVGVSAGGVFNGASLSSGGTEYVVDTGSVGGQTYYVGVRSETALASEYGFLPVFSEQPFSQTQNGIETVNGLLLPGLIPDGSNAHPGTRYVFALAIQPIQVQDVIVTNSIFHQNLGDLVGTLSHNGKGVVLNNHNSLQNLTGFYGFNYYDGPQPPQTTLALNTQTSAGPGSLLEFQGQEGAGPWILTEVDNSLNQTGSVTGLTLTLTPHQNLNQGVNVSISAMGYFYGYIDVPPGTTNLTLSATNISGTALDPNATTPHYPPYGILYEKLGEQPVPNPTVTNYDQTVTLDQIGPFGPGGSIIVDRSSLPPIQPGRYYVTLYNPAAYAQQYFIIATLGIGQVQPVAFTSAGPVPILDDAVTYAYYTNYPGPGATNETIADFNIGLRVQHERISDLVFHLISPDGTRYLLMENRGGTDTNGCGATILTTNNVNVTSSGSEKPYTNFIPVGLGAGTLTIQYNFFTVPDQMTVYLGTNNFSSPIYDTGMTNGAGQFDVTFPSGTGDLTIIMNQYTNNALPGQDLWTYTAGGVQTNFLYLSFTEDTNLTTTPIKFAPVPLVPSTSGGILWTDSFEAYSPGTVSAPGSFGGWSVLANAVAIVTTPPAYDATNALQLNNGAVSYVLPTVAGRQYLLSYALGSLLTEGGGTPTNGNWAPQSLFFTASQNNTPLVLNASGGTFNLANAETLVFDTNALLDAFTLTEIPGDLYYQPEQDMSDIIGKSAYGLWTLEIQDDRVGATNVAPQLLSWQMQFVFADTNPAPATLTPGNLICNPVPANDTLWYQVNVPLNAVNVTNALISSDQPVNLLFNQTSPSLSNSVPLLAGGPQTNGLAVLGLGTNSVPPLVPGSTYYLGVQNPNGIPVVDACVEVDFNLQTLAYSFTEPAQLITGTSAQLNGMATANGYDSTAWFEWGTNTLYGRQTTPVGVGNGYGVVYVTNGISGLALNVPYHYRLVVSNALGVVYGFDQIFDEAYVAAWGANYAGQLNIPTNAINMVAIAGAYDHTLALKTNGQVIAWGDNIFGQSTVPSTLSNAVAVAGGQYYSMALLGSGIVAAWGADLLPGQTNVPPGLSNVVLIAGGTFSSLALQNNGNVVAWGANFYGLTNVPAYASNIVSIAGGSYHSLALKNDGTVIAWGDNTNVPAGLNTVVAVAAGGYHSLALKYDGTVVAWGDDSVGQTDVPAGLTNVVAIAAGGFNSLALLANGAVVTWGDNSAGQSSVPVGLTNMVAISAGYLHSLALTPQQIINLTNGIILSITPGVPQTNSISAGNVTYYQVNVPANADFATNSLLFAYNGPLNVWFSTNTPPTFGTTNDTLLGGGVTNGVWVLNTNGAPKLVPGTTYYLGVRNTNTFTVTYGIEVDFHLVTAPLPPPVGIASIVQTNINGTNGFLITWYAPSNDLFQLQWEDSLTGPWQTFTNPPYISYDPAYPATATNATFTFFDDGSQTGGISPLRFYQLLLVGTVSDLTNGQPQTVSIPAGSTAYYTINVPANVDIATNALGSASVPVNLLFNQNTLPSGANPGGFTLLANSTGGSVLLNAGSTPPLVPGATYYLGVQNTNAVPVTFTLAVGFHVATTTFPIVYPVSGVVYSNGNFVINWLAPTNDIFAVQVSTNLATMTWQTLATNITYTGPLTPTNGLFSYTDTGSVIPFEGSFRFYQVLLTGVAAPGISGFTFTAGGLNLTWSAPANDQFQVAWTTNLVPPVVWTPFPGIITSTNGNFSFTDTNAPMLMKFYELILLP